MRMTLQEALTVAASALRLRRRDQHNRFQAMGDLDDPILAGALDSYQEAADLVQRIADNLTQEGENILFDTASFRVMTAS